MGAVGCGRRWDPGYFKCRPLTDMPSNFFIHLKSVAQKLQQSFQAKPSCHAFGGVTPPIMKIDSLDIKRYFHVKWFRFVLILFLIGMIGVINGASQPVCSAPGDQELENKYNQTREAFYALDRSPQRGQRQQWQLLIEGFKEIYKQHPRPSGEKNPCSWSAGLLMSFTSGRGWSRIWTWPSIIFPRFVNHYPQSPLADDALFLSAEIFFLHKKNLEKAQETALSLIKTYPKGDMKKRAEELLPKLEKSGLLSEADKTDLFKEEESRDEKKAPAGTENPWKSYPQITGLALVTPQYTRIAVDVEGKVSYRQRLLKKDPSIEKPERLYLDLYPARLALGTSPLTIQDGLLRGAGSGSTTLSTVRLVLDIESIKGYKIFFLENPFRLIVDVSGKEKRGPHSGTPRQGKETFPGPAIGIGGETDCH